MIEKKAFLVKYTYYENKKWLQYNFTSPLTRKPNNASTPIPNTPSHSSTPKQ